MADPIDQLVVDEITALLGDIATANGYHTNAGLHVAVDEERGDKPQSAILLEVLDTGERLTEQKLKKRSGVLTVAVNIRVPYDVDDYPSPRRAARLALADVRKAIATINQTQWITGVTGVAIGGRVIRNREDGANSVIASIDINVTFTEQH